MRRSNSMRTGLLCAAALVAAFAAGSSSVAVSGVSRDTPLTADPDRPEWKNAPAIHADDDPMGVPVPHHETEIRSRWTHHSETTPARGRRAERLFANEEKITRRLGSD